MANLFDVKLVFSEIPSLLRYLPTTLWLTLVALLVGLALGLLIALIRIKKIPVLTQLSIAFVSLIRGTPIIVQLYISYFGIPIALKYINYYNGTSYDVNAIPGIVFAMAALGLNQAAFDSETIRSAIQSVEPGQIDAARSMGMTGFQVLRRVIIPQAGSVALLPLGNSVISFGCAPAAGQFRDLPDQRDFPGIHLLRCRDHCSGQDPCGTQLSVF